MKRILGLAILALLITTGCEEENGNGAEESVILSGSGVNTEFKDFQFASLDFMGLANWLIIVGTSGTDTLMITSFVGEQITENQAIALNDTSKLMFFGTIGSHNYMFVNIDVGTSFVSGNITFTDYDLDYTASDATKKIAAEFSAGASLAGGAVVSEESTFKVDISGGFEAPYSLSAVSASRLPAAVRQKIMLDR
jgi:hypothetical protein